MIGVYEIVGRAAVWAVFLSALVLFHEVGHRVVANNKFKEFRNVFFKGFWIGFGTEIWNGKVTAFEFMNCLMAGFAFSLPVPIIAFLFFGEEAFMFWLIIATAGAAVDFVMYFRCLFWSVVHRRLLPLHVPLEDVEGGRKPGLRGL